HHFPRNALHRAGIELLGAALDLSAPGLLDTFLNLDVEALNQRANQIGPILLRQRQCLAKDSVSPCRHGQSLLLSQTNPYMPANRAMASSESHCVTIRNSMPLPRRRERIEALTKPGIFRSAGNVSVRRCFT